MKFCFPFLVATIVISLTTGCQQQQQPTASSRKAGSYAAARRNIVGSNIPQPTSADNVNSTIDDNQLAKIQQNQLNNGASLGGGGGGAR